MKENNAIQLRSPNRVSLNHDYNWRLPILASASLASGLMCWSAMFMGAKLTLAIAIIPLALPFMVAYAAMTERGIMDPTALFPAFFGLYNGVLLIRFLSDDVREHLQYPLEFGPDVFFHAGVLSALGAIFIAITWAFWKPPAHKNLFFPDTNGWFKVGTIFCVSGILVYVFQYHRIGGYWSVLGIDRTKRFEMTGEIMSLPTYQFVLVGLVMMMASGSRLRKRAVTIAMIVLWCVLVQLQGDRRLVLQALMAVISATMFFGAKSTRIKMTHLLLVIMAYVAMSVIGVLREQIPSLVSGNVQWHDLLNPEEKGSLLEGVKPEKSELVGPYLSVLYNVERVRDYSYGATYTDSLFCILPGFLYPQKPLSPSAELANATHHGDLFGFAVAGWGYSPIAEAFLNLGLPGVCLISSAWMGAFIILARFRNYPWGMVTAAVLSSESANVNRIDFRTVYLETFFCVLCILLAAFIVRSFYSRTHKAIGFCKVPQAA